MSLLSVRRSLPEEASRLCEVNVRSIREVCSRDYTPAQLAFWTRNKDPERFHGLFLDPNKCLFTGWLAGKVAGVGMIERSAGKIIMLYLLPEALGKGLGKALLQTMEQTLCEAGFDRVALESTLTAVHFYEHQGYRNLGRFEYLATLPSYRMEKRFER